MGLAALCVPIHGSISAVWGVRDCQDGKREVGGEDAKKRRNEGLACWTERRKERESLDREMGGTPVFRHKNSSPKMNLLHHFKEQP